MEQENGLRSQDTTERRAQKQQDSEGKITMILSQK
jgi:hypothetical protein